MLVGSVGGIEFPLHIRQQEKRLLHRVGDEKDIDQVEHGQMIMAPPRNDAATGRNRASMIAGPMPNIDVTPFRTDGY